MGRRIWMLNKMETSEKTEILMYNSMKQNSYWSVIWLVSF